MNPGSSIPPEIAEEILVNLPVKSLLRFKSVCKPWKNLISDPIFKNHYASKKRKRILLSSPSVFRLNFRPDHAKIVGSSNGLVCLVFSIWKDFIIWNPSTGEYMNLPDPTIPPDQCYTYGFGYESSADDYKIFIATNSTNRIAIEVFSLRINSWRKIRPAGIMENHSVEFGARVYDEIAVTCNRFLHWTVQYFRGLQYIGPRLIVAFNIRREEFIPFATPFFFGLNVLKIGVIDECLCLSFSIDEVTEFWVMKEYGNLNSWQQLFSIPSGFPRRSDSSPICKTTTSGEFLLLTYEKEYKDAL